MKKSTNPKVWPKLSRQLLFCNFDLKPVHKPGSKPVEINAFGSHEITNDETMTPSC